MIICNNNILDIELNCKLICDKLIYKLKNSWKIDRNKINLYLDLKMF
jgi:hypothetical protein